MTISGTAVGHVKPAWGSKADYLIHAVIDNMETVTREQLWARRIDDNRFLICCIPFFVYHLALGDEVVTTQHEELAYVIDRIAAQSEHHTFRVKFLNKGKAFDDFFAWLKEIEGEFEWFSHEFVAIDCVQQNAEAVAKKLWEMQHLGVLAYEDGDAERIEAHVEKGLELRKQIIVD